ncbi:hypothetical protein MUK42_17980, partial [Musa troglodytarum]
TPQGCVHLILPLLSDLWVGRRLGLSVEEYSVPDFSRGNIFGGRSIMDPDAWSRFSAAASKRHQSAPQSRYADASRDPNLRGWRDLYLGFEELDGGEDDPRAEFPCPFCSEDFDIVGLCCHIDDEHPVEAKNGVLLHFPI